jgi:hypothetical protein
MTDIANIVIADGEDTPVNHTFQPVQQSPNAIYRENIADVPVLGQGLINTTLSNNAQIYKVRFILEIPVMEEAVAQNTAGYTAAPKVAHTLRADVVLFAHARSTTQQRDNLITLVSNALQDAQINGMYVNLVKPL